jgi:hypothetical protein
MILATTKLGLQPDVDKLAEVKQRQILDNVLNFPL